MRTKIQGTAPRSCRWFKSNKGSHKDHTEMCGLFFCFRIVIDNRRGELY